ncbi:acyl-coenzyme A thioesterase PaaI-like protein [Zhongshania antarctica]|uniref:Acyl-coenzyme A thioesterase PaaI-like protein n=1 Tax=Zhongshania antarctica TaxID=641702 RepID=A0A840R9M1_9GAMM|nr:PaaI family thioesterase [Zhongshania antarctica]MBB5189011.1 acyl-coenzyme A thioesterase PaaI-like protein [Zhongshania antarctica]
MNDVELQQLINRVPYARTLGIEIGEEAGCFLLPVKKSNIGNPTLPALHGGAIAGFMELSAMIHVLQHSHSEKIPKVVDFAVDYVRAGKYVTTYSRCKLVYLGRRMINVSISAWQDDEAAPITMARAQFLVKD